MISVFSNHFFQWVLQLKNSGHEIYWFDVHDANTYVNKIDFVHQIVRWKQKISYPGKHKIKRHFPYLYNIFDKINSRNFETYFENKLQELDPDVVHSFEMHSACAPIYTIMMRYPHIKWIYTSWGTDIYFFQKDHKRSNKMKKVFRTRLNFMFADCERDNRIANKLGFKGIFLGVFPGGGGYDFSETNSAILPYEQKNIILVKGYQKTYGRCITILNSLIKIHKNLNGLEVIVFGANKEVQKYVAEKKIGNLINLKVFGSIGRSRLMELMGKSFLYIGNSISDGMPNTLLEAIIMGAFPIQSNPGGATAEIIEHGRNGFLIEDPENNNEIAGLIKKAIENPELLKLGIEYNTKNIKPKLEREYIKKQVLEKYNLVEKELHRSDVKLI